MIPNNDSRRQIAFVAGEDYNFLAYSVILVLAELGCSTHSAVFVDYRKIGFLADVVSTPVAHRLVVALLESTGAPPRLHPEDLRYLTLLYDRGEARKPFLSRVVQALHKRSIVHLVGDSDLYLSAPEVGRSFSSEPLFHSERQKIAVVRRLVPQLKRMKLATMKLRLFADFGVRTWDDA